MNRLIAALLLTPTFAFAGSGTYHSSGAFTSLPGYGYQLDGAYTSTGADVVFSATVIDDYIANGIWYASARLTATPTISASAESVSLTINLDVSFINLATGKPGVPTELFSPGKLLDGYSVSIGGGAGGSPAQVIQPTQSELRLSYSNLQQSASISDQNNILNPGGFASGANAHCNQSSLCQNPALAPNSFHFDYTGSFDAGHYLSPSFDPACASLDCTVLAHDTLVAGPFLVQLGVAAVPEPSTYALFALGLAGLTAYSRRRKA